MPLLTERLPVKEKLTDLQKLALFAPFFNRAKVSLDGTHLTQKFEGEIVGISFVSERYDCQFCRYSSRTRHHRVQRNPKKYRKNTVNSCFRVSVYRWTIHKWVYHMIMTALLDANDLLNVHGARFRSDAY
jgi:hypothetical protein